MVSARAIQNQQHLQKHRIVLLCHHHHQIIIIIIIIHEFHRDASLETKLPCRYVSRITLQL